MCMRVCVCVCVCVILILYVIKLHVFAHTYLPTYHCLPLPTITYHYLPLPIITYHYVPFPTITYLPTCMHAYMHTCTHAYMHTCIHAYMHTCIHAYRQTYRHTAIHAYMHTCIHASRHADIQRTGIMVSWTATSCFQMVVLHHLACDPGTQLEKAMQLIFDTMEDMMIIISAPIELSS